jgi:hypothetical protein
LCGFSGGVGGAFVHGFFEAQPGFDAEESGGDVEDVLVLILDQWFEDGDTVSVGES